MHVRWFLLLALWSVACGASAQAYPTKPVTLVVPYPAGGTVDVIGRVLADKLGTVLGQRVIVDNRPGAGGTIGATLASRAAPDGHTILLSGAATHSFAPSLYKSLQYDPLTSFIPVAQASTSSLVLTVNQSFSGNTLKEFLDHLRSHPGKVNYSSNGNGTNPHLAVELLKQETGVSAVHVAYSGGPGALIALMTNEATFSLNHVPIVLPHVNTKKLKAISTTGLKRSLVLPNVPTFDESGLKGFEATAWFGLFFPRNTPAAVVNKVHAALVETIKDPAVNDKLLAQGDEPVGSSPEQFARFLDSELKKWTKVIKTAGIALD